MANPDILTSQLLDFPITRACKILISFNSWILKLRTRILRNDTRHSVSFERHDPAGAPRERLCTVRRWSCARVGAHKPFSHLSKSLFTRG